MELQVEYPYNTNLNLKADSRRLACCHGHGHPGRGTVALPRWQCCTCTLRLPGPPLAAWPQPALAAASAHWQRTRHTRGGRIVLVQRDLRPGVTGRRTRMWWSRGLNRRTPQGCWLNLNQSRWTRISDSDTNLNFKQVIDPSPIIIILIEIVRFIKFRLI